jgi:hypothetical protein
MRIASVFATLLMMMTAREYLMANCQFSMLIVAVANVTSQALLALKINLISIQNLVLANATWYTSMAAFLDQIPFSTLILAVAFVTRQVMLIVNIPNSLTLIKQPVVVSVIRAVMMTARS